MPMTDFMDRLIEVRGNSAHQMVSDVQSTARYRARRFGLVLLAVLGAFLTLFLFWANHASMDEITRGAGKVIASGQNKVVQHLEGGIVRAILVREGDTVKDGQILLRIDSTPSRAMHQGKLKEYYALLARAARLRSEAEGKSAVQFTEDIEKNAPREAANERARFLSHRAQYRAEIEVLEKQVQQKRQELRETQSSIDRLAARLKSEQQELAETRKDYRLGVVARFDVLRLERQVNETVGGLRTERLKMPRVRAALREVQSKLDERKTGYLAEIRKELSDVQNRAAALKPIIAAGQDRVKRTDIRSPVHGIVKQVGITTIGAVIKAGDPLVEIVPIDGSLVVEVKIQPSDRAFLHPGQDATVKLSAYDYSIYGGLEGTVEDISADAIEEENPSGDSYYRVRIRTKKNYLDYNGARLPILNGMTANVDIKTGRKTVLDHLLSPVYRLMNESLQER